MVQKPILKSQFMIERQFRIFFSLSNSIEGSNEGGGADSRPIESVRFKKKGEAYRYNT